jgi:phage terminase large subunit
LIEKINISEKFEPLFDIPKGVDVFILTGGRYSQKSFATSLSTVINCDKYKFRTLYSRYTNASLKDSIYAEVDEKVKMMQLDDYFNLSINRIDSKFNDAKIVFKGLKAGSNQQTANLKGLKDFSCWVLDEAEELIDEDIYDKIFLSIRGNHKDNPIPNIKILILNPTTKEHFVYKKYFEAKGIEGGFNGVKDNVCYIHTTYLDCLEFVPKEIQDYFEKMKINNPSKYNHVVLGGWLDKAEGVIFSNWRIGEFEEHSKIMFGQDYGFSIDPTTLDKISIDKANKKIYVKECFHKIGLNTSEIYNENIKHVSKELIVGDSAEPRLISELKARGLNIKGISKPKIIDRIALVQDYELIVDPESINVIKELNNYVWHDKKSETPIDDYNHHLDPIGYVVWDFIGKPNRGQYIFS